MWSLAILFCSNNPVLSLLNNAPVKTQEFVHWQSNRLLEGTNKTLCTPGLRRKEQWPHERLTQTCPWVSRRLRRRCGLVVACYRQGALSAQCMHGTFRRRSPVSSLPPPQSAAAAESLQSCPTLCDPIGRSPPGSPISEILQARTLEWVAISFSNVWKWKMKVKSLSRVWLFATPWTAAYQAPLSLGFSRQEYWSGVPLPSPECTGLC